MNLNYTSICHYCGLIYKSNKSTSTYCCKQHNSLYHANGSQIDFNILNDQGVYVNYHEVLAEIYKTWIEEALNKQVPTSFCYEGPLPKANELLLVSGFIVKRQKPNESFGDFAIKPMQLLTKEEKASSKIISPDASYFYR